MILPRRSAQVDSGAILEFSRGRRDAAAGFRQMIGYIDAANEASLAIHQRFGFRRVGYLPQIGYKFGHWTDSVMVQRSLGLGSTAPPEG